MAYVDGFNLYHGIEDTLRPRAGENRGRSDRLRGKLVEVQGAPNKVAKGKWKEREAPSKGDDTWSTGTKQRYAASARMARRGDNDTFISADCANVGGVSMLKARTNSEIHISQDLKSDGKDNLFVILGEPDIQIKDTEESNVLMMSRGIVVYDLVFGNVRSDDLDGIVCWMIDTDYNEECFFVRHAYFLGADSHCVGPKRGLKAEIDKETWDNLHNDTSRPSPKPKADCIAVKVISHFGDEVLKAYRVGQYCSIQPTSYPRWQCSQQQESNRVDGHHERASLIRVFVLGCCLQQHVGRKRYNGEMAKW
jgi:hypothetical protein